jgi:3-oxoacyl-[acyl-carrier protein] reductase
MNRKLTAVVTGGTRGIGLGIAEALARRGASLAITYRGDDPAAEAARERLERLLHPGSTFMCLKGDSGDAAVVSDHYACVCREMGPANILVNNAGIMVAKAFETVTEADWNETLRINLSSAFYWSSKVIAAMKAQNFGRIINIASVAARGGGVIGPHYAASKAGMLGLTRYAARELGPHGITVNAIAPAFIADAGIFTGWSPEQRAKLKANVLVPRIGDVQDVVRAFDYLMDSGFVTGVTLDVNGGVFMI